MNCNTGARRLVGEPLFIFTVHLGKVLHIDQEDIDLDDLLDATASGLEDGRQVLAALGGLFGDGTFDEVGGSVRGDLAGDEDLVRGGDGLGLEGTG